jgi:fructosamine-3-kinase
MTVARPGQGPAATGEAIGAATGRRLRGEPRRLAAGGGGGECLRWPCDVGDLFVKLVPAARLDMLEAETEGLEALRGARAVRVPAVEAVGLAGGHAFLALEWIDLRPGSAAGEAALGRQLACLHRCIAPRHGWHRDNTIGATPQHNAWCEDWARFFAVQRLGTQLDLAERAGHGGRWLERGRRLCERVGALLDGHRPEASLLHGDLWGGNWAADRSGAPVIFDPAVYHGDRETDLAMTRLFGGFGPAFHEAYASEWPLEPGASRRVALYNVYHVLNHLNLFGGGYRAQAEATIERLLADAG